MEEWDFIDEHELHGRKGARIWLACRYFAYGIELIMRMPGMVNLQIQIVMFDGNPPGFWN